MNLAREQIQGEHYKEGLDGLERIVSDFADTDTSAEALTMIPSTYVSWGSNLRDDGQFEQAEQAFYRFKLWSQNNQRLDLEKDAQRELAQMYVAWGLSIQSQKQYENALAKFDQAISADPQSEFASTGQAKEGKRSVYVEWGNELLEQDQVPEALEKFGNAVSLADGGEDNGARDALANGYLHWASDLGAEEDFRGALDQLETAQGKAVSDSMKELVKAAFEETYLAFSTSSGPQAMRAMQDSFRMVCEQHTEPDLPILGLNMDSVRIGIYGVDPTLFEKVAAKTSGEAHYLACVQEKEQTIDVDVENALYRLPDGYLVIPIERRYRIKTIWTITVRKSDTGQELATKVFEGGNPPPFPGKGADAGNGIFKGTPPDINAILQWLQSVIQ
jgi:tetratricopeptide (TPR) repeat protein